ncbi:putative transmembrane protein [Apostichopus japonicus]|uniref:Putative transmembrane protein n=2 Tax=Stichopus japonicus TaxID=307972 RepID=A0A2G8JV55_STIJA|nr:putative transmembrane protein [Apostichopus japonicus]
MPLLALRLDDTINISYWAVFLPLWLWKAMVMLGALFAGLVWWRHPEYRVEGEGYVDMKAIIICLVLNSLLFVFEIMVCDQLERSYQHNLPLGDKTHNWLIVFMPLFLTAPVSIAACVWGFKHDRGLELEAMCSINILQFIFIALKLEKLIRWNWAAVFIPVWILTCLMCLIVLYYIIWSILILRAPDLMAEQRRAHLRAAVGALALVVPLLTFEVLLVHRLDNNNDLPYIAVCCPLYITLLVLIPTSFGQRSGNHWWFGIRKDFCTFILDICPFLREYGNITVEFGRIEAPEGEEEVENDFFRLTKVSNIEQPQRIVMPIINIEMPD